MTNLDLKDFSGEQRQALLDLLVMAMYADRHLALAEDARVHRLLGAMEIESPSERQRQFDAAISRAREHSESSEAGAAQAVLLAQKFTTRQLRGVALNLLEDLMGSDRQVTAEEKRFLSVIEGIFRK